MVCQALQLFHRNVQVVNHSPRSFVLHLKKQNSRTGIQFPYLKAMVLFKLSIKRWQPVYKCSLIHMNCFFMPTVCETHLSVWGVGKVIQSLGRHSGHAEQSGGGAVLSQHLRRII